MMRCYKFLLYLFPASFRNEYGGEMCAVFAKRLEDANGVTALSALWLQTVFDVLTNAAGVHLDILRQDLRYTARSLARTPGFTLTAVIITGLGIGANTAVFSITDHVLLHPLPFADSSRLVQLWQRSPGYSQVELSPPNFVDWRNMSTSFEAMAASASVSGNLLGQGDPQRLEGFFVTPEFFPMLGVQPAIGRVFSVDDVRMNASPTIILSYGLWQTAFGGTPDVVGKTIRLDDLSQTVIGVMPASFSFPGRGAQMWMPMMLDNASLVRNGLQARDNLYLQAMAKLKPGVSIGQARAEMGVIADQLARQYPKENDKTGATVSPLGDIVPSQTRLLIWSLFGASICVLLIACTNLANLLLARAMARRKELTVRAAIGAGRERLVRQLLTESLLLALAGGTLGVLIAIATLPLLTALVPPSLPIAGATVLDPRVFAFAAIVTLGTGLGFGVIPALRICSGTDNEGLREGSRSATGDRKERLRSILVIAEITASVILLVSAGLLIRALWRVQSIDPGFRADSVLTVQTSLPMPRYASTSTRSAFYTEVLSNVRTLPGVSNAAFVSFLPMAPGVGGIWPIEVPGTERNESSGGGSKTAGMRFVTPGYFDSMGIPLQAGRDVSESDTLDSPLIAVVSESFARRYWPSQNPIGRRFHFAMNDFQFALQDRIVAGVVGDIRFRGLERDSEPQVYLAYRQVPDGTATYYFPKELVVRSSTDSTLLVPAIRHTIQKADPELPISAIRALRSVVDLQTAPRSIQLRLVAAFAALSLLLSAIGIYGLLSFTVGQRSPEFGLRIALGAQSRNILSLVLREGLLLAGAGTALGIVLAYWTGRSMVALLAGVAPSDPVTLAISGIVVLTMTLLGSLIPAVRAMSTDPTNVIRGE